MSERSARVFPATNGRKAYISSLALKQRGGVAGDHMTLVRFDAANGPLCKHQEVDIDPDFSTPELVQYVRCGDFQ